MKQINVSFLEESAASVKEKSDSACSYNIIGFVLVWMVVVPGDDWLHADDIHHLF